MKPTNALSLIQLFTILLALLLYSCSDTPSNPTPEPFGPNKVVYDVTYSDNLIILKGGEKNALVRYDTSNWSEFIFRTAQIESELTPGKLVIIENLAAFKILEAIQKGDELLIKSTRSNLPDLIKNGKISWDFTPEMSKLSITTPDGKEIKVDKIQSDSVEFNFDWGANHYTIWMKPNGISAQGLPEILVNLTVINKDPETGQIYGTYGAKGMMRLPRQSTSIDIANNSVTNFNSSNKGIRCELTLEYITGASFAGGEIDLSFPELMFSVPVQSLTSIPIPIPMNINFGLEFDTKIIIPDLTSTATAKIKLILDSDAGFKFVGPSVNIDYKINDEKVAEFDDWEVGDFSLAPVGVEVKYQVSLPRIAIEILDQEVAWFACVARTETKLVMPSLCKYAFAQIRIEGGYGISILGYSLVEGYKLFWEKSREVKSDGC